MRTKLASFSPLTEFALVIGLTFGVSMVLYFFGIIRHGFSSTVFFSDTRLIRTVLFEICIGSALTWFLYLRGWRLTDFPVSVSAQGTGIGILLWVGSWALSIFITLLLFGPLNLGKAIQSISFHGHLSIPVLILVCLVNPIFEELLTLGYVLKSLESHGASFAIGVSCLLRLSVHLYQGPLAAVSILPIGVLFAGYYWKSRQLWPPILAHIVFDFVGLLQFT